MPAPIVIRNLTPETKKAANPEPGEPLIATKADLRDGSRGAVQPPTSASNWLSHSQASRAPAPLLRFTDLISGPATGLGDGLGSGVIVTIWAQGVGDSQGTGQVYFTDFAGTKRPAEHVYYWKRADGQLPSGPARLWYSHLMQEIAFSIPAGSVDGLGQITVETGGQVSNTLPFTVRAGNIYHIMSTGADGSAGTFNDPWLTTEGALYSQNGSNLAPAGSTIYVHDVTTGSLDAVPVRGLYWNNGDAASTKSAQFATVAYPGRRPTVYAQRAFENYLTAGWVMSKYDIYSGNYLEVDEFGQPVGTPIEGDSTYGIQASKEGRAIANRIQDLPGGVSDKYDGAIKGNADRVSGFMIVGNEIHDHGDHGSTKLHHATYITVRRSTTVDAWEFHFNFLHGNRAKFGIHSFEQNTQSVVLGTLRVNDNVICEQGNGALSVGADGGCNWSCDYEALRNVMIDVGLASAWDGKDVTTAVDPEYGAMTFRDGGDKNSGLTGIYTLEDNLVYSYSRDHTGFFTNQFGIVYSAAYGALRFTSGTDALTMNYNRNVVYSDQNLPFYEFGSNTDPASVFLSAGGNTWFNSLDSAPKAALPDWDANQKSADPKITIDGAIVTVAPDSPLIGTGSNAGHDLYGVPRTNMTDGPVEAIV